MKSEKAEVRNGEAEGMAIWVEGSQVRKVNIKIE